MKHLIAGMVAVAMLGTVSVAQQQENRQNSHQTTTTQPTNPGDVPHQGPGSQSPDLKQQSTTNATSTHQRNRRNHPSKRTRTDQTGTQR